MLIGKPVDPVSATSTSRAGNAGAAEPGVAGGLKVNKVKEADNVTLSDAGRALTAPGPTVDAVRTEKVAALKKAVEEGTYHVRAKVVGDRMIAEAAELLEVMAASR